MNLCPRRRLAGRRRLMQDRRRRFIHRRRAVEQLGSSSRQKLIESRYTLVRTVGISS